MHEVIDTLLEIERLKRLDRTGWTLRGLPNGTESVAAHSFGVCVTAMLLSDELVARGIAVNIERVLRMALLHDLAETRLGDLPRTAKDYFPDEVSKQAEHAAFIDIISRCDQSALYRGVYEDYEQRASFEAQVVKVADILDLLVEALALERAGVKGLDEFWKIAEQPQFDFQPPVQVVINGLFEALLTARSELR